MFEFVTLPKLIQFGRIILDIGIMSVIFYYALRIVRNNARTVQIFKGILLIFIINMLSKIFGLDTVQSFTEIFMTWGILAVFIIFQPEIRAVLEKLGKSSVFTSKSALSISERDNLINEISESVSQLAHDKIGALITIEAEISLNDYVETGTKLNSDVSHELLSSIFIVGTPLHDGAVIIQGNKIAAAAAFFPPTEEWLPSKYGARHRAGVGISEVSDSITIIVSEETGLISIARDGRMSIIKDTELKDYLHKFLYASEIEVEIEREVVDKAEERVTKIEQELRTKLQEEMDTTRVIRQFSKVKATDDNKGGEDDVE